MCNVHAGSSVYNAYYTPLETLVYCSVWRTVLQVIGHTLSTFKSQGSHIETFVVKIKLNLTLSFTSMFVGISVMKILHV